MSESTYWTKSRLNRRTMLRASGIGALGLGGAALIGCGDSGDDTATTATTDPGAPATTGTNGATTATTDWYSGPRAPGFDPALGVVPINEKEPVPGGTFTRWRPDTSRQNDVDLSAAGADAEIVMDRLTTANGWNMELEADLLESWEIADDGLSIVMKIRPDIKTHNKEPVNGRIFTAEDVAYSLERKAGIIDPVEALKYPRAGQYVGVERAEVVDDTTVRVVLNQPNSAIMAVLADPRAQVFPREQDEIGWQDPMNFVGTGARMQTQYVDGSRQVFERFPDYYRTASEGGHAAYDIFEILILSDRSSQLAAFLTGQLSVLYTLQPHELPQLHSSMPDALIYEQPNFGWVYFAGNMSLPFNQDERVRKAIHYSIDYAALMAPYGDPMYSGPHHVMYPESHTSEEIKAMFAYNPDTKPQAIAEAKKMMTAAGYPDGAGISYELTINTGSGPRFDDTVRLQEQWANVFPAMDVQVGVYTDYATYTNLLATRTSEARVAHHTMAPTAIGREPELWIVRHGSPCEGPGTPCDGPRGAAAAGAREVVAAKRVERARVVLLATAGLRTAATAERLGCSRPRVIHWRQRYARGGPAPRSGAPRRLPEDIRETILAPRWHRRRPNWGSHTGRRDCWGDSSASAT